MTNLTPLNDQTVKVGKKKFKLLKMKYSFTTSCFSCAVNKNGSYLHDLSFWFTLNLIFFRALSTLTNWEENLFEKITEAIINSDEGYITDVEAVNLGSTLKNPKVSVAECEISVNKLVKNVLLNRVSWCGYINYISLWHK